jgi:predicted N-acetyltransferase YhbS
MEEIRIRRMNADDMAGCGRICYEAFAAIADRHGFPHDFASVAEATSAVSHLATHPGFFSLVAERQGRVVGSNFLDERSVIRSVGPVTIEPEQQNRGTGRALVDKALERAAQRQSIGVRLLQAGYHNRSLSLYTKLGFDVRESFATVRGAPLDLRIPGRAVRPATDADIAACNSVCAGVHGHDRGGELRDAVAQGSASVVERRDRITGYSTGIGFFGHSVAETDDDLAALIAAAPHFGGSGFLAPLRNSELLRWCLTHGLRITHTMNLMTIGFYQQPRGAYLASVGY